MFRRKIQIDLPVGATAEDLQFQQHGELVTRGSCYLATWDEVKRSVMRKRNAPLPRQRPRLSLLSAVSNAQLGASYGMGF